VRVSFAGQQSADGTMPSLAIGPINTAGQAYQWSEAVSRELGISAWSFSGNRPSANRIVGPAHHRIPHHRLRPGLIRRLWLQGLLRSRTHLLVESMLPLFGDPRTGLLDDELHLIEDMGLVVGGVCHGSDVRSPERHMARLGHSYFRLLDDAARRSLEVQAARRREALVASGIPAFVSTPDLTLDVPSAKWLPLVVDSHRWMGGDPALAGNRPVVLHAPSRRRPSIKGSDYIEPILEDMNRQGLIRYRPLVGTVPHREMPRLVREADVVVEQILAGSYGVAAVEGMAAGRLVIGYVGEEVRRAMPEDPPIVDATPGDFLATMLQVVDDRAEYAMRAARGPGFVSRVHSGRLSAQVLSEFVGG